MADSSSDKTQDPTPRRRQQAREKGQVAFSQDLSSTLLLFVALVGLLYLGKKIITFFALLIQKQLGLAPQLSINSDYVLATFQGVVGEAATAYIPFLVLLFVSAIFISLLQTGILFNPDKLAPDISRLSPLKGMQRIFSITGFMKLGFGIFKIILVAIVAGVVIYLRRQEIMSLSGLEVSQIAGFLADISISTALWCSAVLLALAILDYAFQKWKHEQDLKMSEQEVRDEMKEMQGDPQMIARRRAVARQMVMNRVSDAVPDAGRCHHEPNRTCRCDTIQTRKHGFPDCPRQRGGAYRAADSKVSARKQRPHRRTKTACATPLQRGRNQRANSRRSLQSSRRSLSLCPTN